MKSFRLSEADGCALCLNGFPEWRIKLQMQRFIRRTRAKPLRSCLTRVVMIQKTVLGAWIREAIVRLWLRFKAAIIVRLNWRTGTI